MPVPTKEPTLPNVSHSHRTNRLAAEFSDLAFIVAASTSPSHNGCNLGKAFVRARGRGTGRYRVVAPNGVECRVGIDAESPVVEIFSPGTVLQVSQVRSYIEVSFRRPRTV